MVRIYRYVLAFLMVLAMGQAGVEAKHGGKSGILGTLTFGIEGSYISTAASYRHFNYISAYGYRIDRKFWNTMYHSNGEFLMHIGVDISDKFNLSVYTGRSGINRGTYVVPLTLRGSCYFGKDPSKGRWLAFLDAGPGLSGYGDDLSLSGMFKAGTGYRIPLGRYTRLDFLVSFRTVVTGKGIMGSSMSSSIYIPEENLRRSDALYLAMTFGIGITF